MSEKFEIGQNALTAISIVAIAALGIAMLALDRVDIALITVLLGSGALGGLYIKQTRDDV